MTERDPQSLTNPVLAAWNAADVSAAADEILPCCGSSAWAEALVTRRPFATPADLFRASDYVWQRLPEEDWREAFNSHPRIGQQHAASATQQSLAWSSEEQRAAATADETAQQALAQANREYEQKFGRIFIICATGKSTSEILAMCNARMSNSLRSEMIETAEQQRQITQLRLRRWLAVS